VNTQGASLQRTVKSVAVMKGTGEMASLSLAVVCMHTHTHTGDPTGDSVQTGDITNRGQSPIGGCVFKQMSPSVGVYKRIHVRANDSK